jgi:CRP-like cAMP-binding protein
VTYSSKEKHKKMTFELVKAKKKIIKKELLRPKLLIEGAPPETVKNPSFFICQARENFIKRQNSIYSSSTCKPSKASITRMPSRHIRQSLPNMNIPEHPKRIKKSSDNSNDTLPNWLVERPGFQEIIKSFININSTIPDICAQPSSVRSQEKKNLLFDWISSLTFFSKIPSRVTKEVCDKLTRHDYEIAEVIIKKGERGDCIVIIYSGKVNIYLEPGVVHCTVGEKSVIGEQALDNNRPRNATVIAIEPVITFKLTKFDYDTILINMKKQEKAENLAFLANISFFKNWNHLRVQNLAYYILQKTYNPGEVVFDIGHPSDTFFIIRSGYIEIQAMVTLQKNNIWPTGSQEWKVREINRKYIVSIAKLGPGNYFGESCILDRCNRQTRAVSLTNTLLLTVNIDEFYDIFSSKDIEDIQLNAPVSIPSDDELKAKLTKEIQSKIVNVIFI